MKNHILQIALFCLVRASCNEPIVIDNSQKENYPAKEAYYRFQMKKKGFSLVTQRVKDDVLEHTLHERSIAYIDTRKFTGSGRIIEFKIKKKCCQRFLGDYDIINDTLIFKLEQVNDVVCSSLCWYYYRLNLTDVQEDFSELKIIVE